MEDEIPTLLRAAWQKLLPHLNSHPDQLAKRLARRNLALLSHPPRAWCLALRSTDSRLDRYACQIPDKTHRHQILLDANSVQFLCRPIHIPRPGLTVSDLASLLGTTPAGLLLPRLRKTLQTHYLQSPKGKPTPLLYSPIPLDPSSRSFQPYDPVWSVSASHNPDRIPDHLEQILIRVPIYINTRPFHDIENLHPEHPHVDSPPPRNKSRALPPPHPDYVAYKWRDGLYVGHDWKRPAAVAGYLRQQQRLQKARAASKARRDRTPYQYEDKLQFRGYRFECPKCQKLVHLLYYPLPRLQLLGEIPHPPSSHLAAPLAGRDSLPTSNQQLPTSNPAPSFACRSCHKINHPTRHKTAWNEIVTYLTAGLLYGHEVPKPSWFKLQRKNQYAPHLNRPPSKRRPQIESLLLQGQSIKQIAQALSLSIGTILFYSKQIYREHNVKSLRDLLLKHNLPLRPGMRGPGKAKRGDGRQPRTKKQKSSSPHHPLTQSPHHPHPAPH